MSTPTSAVNPPVETTVNPSISAVTNSVVKDSGFVKTAMNSASPNPGTPSSVLDIETKQESPSAALFNSPSNLGKRRAGVRARENLSSLVAATDDESDDDRKPSKKRVKASNPTAPLTKTHTRIGDKGIFIGTHKMDAELPVYARYYPNGPLNCRVYYEDCSDEVISRNAEFFKKKAQCTMEVILFDGSIFNSPGVPDMQTVGVENQKKRIRAYLALKGVQPPNRRTPDHSSNTAATSTTDVSGASKAKTGPSVKTAPSKASTLSNEAPGPNEVSHRNASTTNGSSSKPSISKVAASKSSLSMSKEAPAVSSQKSIATSVGASENPSAKQSVNTVVFPSDLHIGFWKPKPTVAVYAYLKPYSTQGISSLCFRVHRTEVDEETRKLENFPGPRFSLRFDTIHLKDEFVKGSEAATKSLIKSLLQVKETSKQQQVVDDSEDGDDDDIPAVAHIFKGNVAEKGKERERKMKKRQGAARSRNQRGTLGQLSKSTQEEDSDGDDIMMQDATLANDQNPPIANNPAPEPAAISGMAKAQSNCAKDELIRSQKATIKEQEIEIAQLQDQVRRLSEARRPRVPTTVAAATRVVGASIYHILQTGPNAGKLLTKTWRKVFIDGKWYKEWTAMSEIKLNMGNVKNPAEVERIGDMNFYRVPDGEHEGKWVQTISEQSFYESPEGKFVKWTLREEIEDGQRFIL